MARMSRTMPPTPVAAPWRGSTAEGWLWDSTLNTTANPSPMSTAPAFSAPDWDRTLGRAAGKVPQQGTGVLVTAVLAPERAKHTQFHGIGLPVQPVNNHVILGLA